MAAAPQAGGGLAVARAQRHHCPNAGRICRPSRQAARQWVAAVCTSRRPCAGDPAAGSCRLSVRQRQAAGIYLSGRPHLPPPPPKEMANAKNG